MALNGVYSGNGNGASTGRGGVGGAATALTKPKTQISSGHNLNSLIYLMYARHNFVFCSALINRCIESGCDLEYPYYIKGLIERHQGKLAEAIKSFQKAVEYNSTNTESYREIAKTLYQMGRFKQSLEIFIRTDSILKRADCETHYYIAKLLSKNIAHGQLKRQDAKEYYLKAVQLKHLASMHELAEIYVRQGDLAKSIELLENSLQINCDDVHVLTRMGVLHLMAGETQTAFTRLLDALVIDASSPKLLLALGGILQARGDADGALNKYKSIENLAEQGAEIWSNLGLCFMRNQKLIAAISCLRKSIWIAPLNFNALFNLGYVFLKAKLYASAFHTFATAINLKPNHVECFVLLGVCLSALNDQKNAIAALEKAVTLPDATKYPLSFLNFAIVCFKSEAYGRSRKNLDRYLELVEIKSETDQQSHGMTNHLKVARKLMGLLKLITVEPEHPHELGNEDISSPPVENSGPDNSVVNRSDDGNISPSDYEGNEPNGPSLVAVPAAIEGKADVDEDDDDSLEGGAAGDYEADDYEFMTVVADVERRNN